MHGDLDNVYKTLQHLEKVHSTKIDLLLCCGDFQVGTFCTLSYRFLLFFPLSFNFMSGHSYMLELGCQK